MASHGPGDRNTNLIAAAEAAASWARARRAAWTKAPQGARTAHEPLPPIEFESPPAVPAPRPVPRPAFDGRPNRPSAAAGPAPPPIGVSRPAPPASSASSASSGFVPEPIAFAHKAATVTVDPTPPPFVAATHDGAHDDRGASASLTTWLARIAVAAAAIGGAAIAWPYVSTFFSSESITAPKSTAPLPAGSKAPGPKAGILTVASSPAGAQVLVDGKARGVTPLTLPDLPIGKHEVLLKSDAGSVRRTVTIAAGRTESLDEQIFSGWVTVYSPFEVTIAEGSRLLRPDDRNQFMLPPGIHELRITNKALAYEAVLQVDVKPGEGANVRLTPPPSSLTVTAPDAAEVTVDGTRAGEAPLTAFPVALGTHDIVVRRPNGSEKRFTITVGVKPYTLNAEF